MYTLLPPRSCPPTWVATPSLEEVVLYLRGEDASASEQGAAVAAEGLVPARNTVDVRLVLSPPRRETYEFSVFCTLRPGAASGGGQGACRRDQIHQVVSIDQLIRSHMEGATA